MNYLLEGCLVALMLVSSVAPSASQTSPEGAKERALALRVGEK